MNATYKYFFTTNRLIVLPAPSTGRANNPLDKHRATTAGQSRIAIIIAIITASPIDSPIVCQVVLSAPIDRRLSAAQGLARLRNEEITSRVDARALERSRGSNAGPSNGRAAMTRGTPRSRGFLTLARIQATGSAGIPGDRE